jgi:hypothetical protein
VGDQSPACALQAILAREPRGIPVEKNAAAALWELIPSQLSSENTSDHSQAHLSAADQLPARERLVSPPPPPAGMEAEGAEQVLEACTRGVWHAADHPWLAGWLDDNSAALAQLLIAIAQRDRLPAVTSSGSVDFQFTRGLLGVTT